MARLRIKTREEFSAALRSIPFAVDRYYERLALDDPLADYGLWHSLLGLVHSAVEESNWTALNSLLALYDAVERAGPRSEMYEASFVAFVEDICLPDEPAQLREFWRHAPPAISAAIKQYRALR